MSAERVLVVGGGISGLATAYYLSKAGVPVTLVERHPRLGGVITTETVEGCVIEGGPDSFLAAKPAALELIRELGLEGEVIGSNDHQRVTYIVRNGDLVPMPDGLMMMVPTKIWPMATTPLLGLSTKIRMGLEYFRSPPAAPAEDRTVSDFVSDHYGAEAVEYLAEPLLAGVYGGSPDRLSVSATLPRFVELEQKYGSLTKGVLSGPRPGPGSGSLFKTLKRGLASLVEALQPHVRNVIHGEAEAFEPGRLRVNGEWLEASQIVLACPAHEAGLLLEGADRQLAATLSSIDYTSSITLALGYKRSRIAHPLNGFGFLVPRKERGALVACTWVGTKFSHRVPDGWALLRCFLTGTEFDQSRVEEELARLMGITVKPDFVRASRWPRAMAQYTVGHAARIAEIENRAAAIPSLHLVGNAYQGIGIPDCIRMGKQAAAKIASGRS
ncbi:MAG: protoporphyrinogen oxidase [Bryobacteraceae bacterium]